MNFLKTQKVALFLVNIETWHCSKTKKNTGYKDLKKKSQYVSIFPNTQYKEVVLKCVLSLYKEFFSLLMQSQEPNI